MARRRTSLALIANQRTRATTYKKRKAGLIKKAGELATLCDIPVAVVCAGPDGGAPTVWVSPEGREDGDVIARYRALPAEKRAKHTHVVYLQEELDKKKAKLAALQQKGPRELEPPDAALDGMSQEELQQLLASIDAALLATAERREALGLLSGADDADGGGRRDSDVDVPPAHHGVPCTGTNSVGVPATCDPFHPYNAGVTLVQPGYNNVQYMGGHGVDMNGYQMQMPMPSNGSNNHGQLAWGAFQPCNATVVQPVYGHLQYWDNNVDGNQMQPAPAANGGWHNPAGTWGNDDGEPCNAIMPSAGHSYIDIEGDIDGNYIDTTVFDYQTTSTSDNFMDAPVQFLTTGSDESIITNVAGGDETEFSIDDLLQCSDTSQHSSSLEQLHYLSDLADGFDFGCSYDVPLDLCWDDD